MDTTETYIKMCDCKEIQAGITWDKGHIWNDGDYFSLEGWGKNVYSFFNHPVAIYNATWLPRQDKLQEMLLEPLNTLCPDLLTMLRLFNVFASVNPQFASMEQLWLAFVMKEKHNKVWDGDEWKLSS